MSPHDDSASVIARLVISGRDPIDLFGSAIVGRDPRDGEGQPVEVAGDPLVSKSHFALAFHDGSPTITDLGSSNGTYLHHADGETAVPTDRAIELPVDAEVEFGDQRLRVEMVDGGSGGITASDDMGGEPAVPPIAPADPWGAGSVGSDDSITCAQCERMLPADARFCDSCGTSTDSSVDATPPSAPAVEPPSASAPAPPTPAVATTPGSAYPIEAPDFVSEQVPSAGSRGPAGKIGIAVAALALVGIGIFGVSRLFGGDDSTSDAAFPNIPEGVAETWSESIDGESISAGVGANSVYTVSIVRDEAELTSLARSDGDANWSVTADVPGFFGSFAGEFGDVVVFEVCDEDCDLVGHDRETGDEIWSESHGDGFVYTIGSRLYLEEDDQIELIDPANGDTIERVRGDRIFRSGSFLLSSDSNEVEVFDNDLEPVFGPVDVDDDATAVAFGGDELVIAVDDELQFIDAEGDVVRESRLGVGAVFSIRVVADDNLVVETDEGVLSVDPIDGRADERWSERGSLAGVFDVQGGVVVLVDDDGSSDTDVLDADSGDSRFTIDDLQELEVFVIPGSNAAVVFRRDLDSLDFENEIDAFDWETGDELWDDTLEGRVSFGDGGVVEVGTRGEVTLYE